MCSKKCLSHRGSRRDDRDKSIPARPFQLGSRTDGKKEQRSLILALLVLDAHVDQRAEFDAIRWPKAPHPTLGKIEQPFQLGDGLFASTTMAARQPPLQSGLLRIFAAT